MRKTVLIVLLTLLKPDITIGQYQLESNEDRVKFNSIDKEQVFIHYNDNFLLSGEYFYYKMYCLNNKDLSPSKISKIGYVELINSKGKVIFKHKIGLTNGLGQGDFFIPVTLNTGHYKLVGYTNWMRNSGVDSYFVGDIAIINPFNELSNETNYPSENIIYNSKTDSIELGVISKEKNTTDKILLSKKNYKKLELVTFQIKNTAISANANISISVRKKDPITIPFNKNKSIDLNNNAFNLITLNNNEAIFLPELRGELITGKLINKLSKQGVANKNISISIGGDFGVTKISQTDKNGTFFFNLVNNNRSNEIIFNLLDNHIDANKIVLDTSNIRTDTFKFKNIGVSKNLNPILEKRSVYNQIENAFFETKLDSLISSISPTPVYNIFDELYNLDDYTRFKTLEETLIEIIDNVLVKKRKGQYKIQIRENNHYFIDEQAAPLFLVDKILVQNSSDLFNFNVNKIQNIGISRDEYYIGPRKYQGIFSIETKEGNYNQLPITKNSIKFNIDGPLPLKDYYFQEYKESIPTNKSHIADFRQQLLWLPKVNLKENNLFKFYTSENLGTYEISIEGFTQNGEAISLTEYIYVE
ncbi:hypothetical protein [Aurantibacter sp.]|uniref:hypothetical protein n=1 Tax=Aurantibacter sp. TaxID=2807103 RepID=UPI0032635786